MNVAQLHPKRNPNATVGGLTGLGGGELVVEALDQVGVHLTAGEGVAIAAGLAWLGLMIGRKGIRGLIRALWDGNGSAAS